MDFESAQEQVKQLKTRPDDQTLLELYGLYKQATLGDCHTPQPWKIEIKKRAKWDAWNSRRGMDSVEAKNAYIELVEELLKKDN